MTPTTLTPAEARAYLAESEDNRVKDCHGDKWKSVNGLIYGKWDYGWTRVNSDRQSFELCAPFTPYVRRTKRQLREQVAELEAALADQSEALTAAYMAGSAEWAERANAALNEALVWRERALAAEESAKVPTLLGPSISRY